MGAAQIVAKPDNVQNACQRLFPTVNAVKTFGY